MVMEEYKVHKTLRATIHSLINFINFNSPWYWTWDIIVECPILIAKYSPFWISRLFIEFSMLTYVWIIIIVPSLGLPFVPWTLMHKICTHHDMTHLKFEFTQLVWVLSWWNLCDLKWWITWMFSNMKEALI